MKRGMQDERGIALVAAIVGLVVGGALVAGALFVSTLENRLSDNSRRLQQSFAVAEGGGYEAVRLWSHAVNNSKAVYPGDSLQLNGQAWTTMPNQTGSYKGYVYKLNGNLYLIDVTGRDTTTRTNQMRGRGAQQRIGILARIYPLQVPAYGALTFGFRPMFGGGNANADGNDHIPNGSWTGQCPPLDSAKAGVTTPYAVDLQQGSNQWQGNPPISYNPAVSNPLVYSMFGGTSYASLASTADITIGAGAYSPAPVLAGGLCNKAVSSNWGDGLNHANPCGGYFPIIHATGNITLSAGQGQGIFLADGDVTFTGTGTWFGVMIVRGTLRSTSGQLPKFYGVMLAEHADLWNPNQSGNLDIFYSKCVLNQVLSSTGVVALHRSRSWVQLY